MNLNDLRDDAGQLIIMGFVGTEMSSSLRVVLRAVAPSGVILFARNVKDAPRTWQLLQECREAIAAATDTPPFLCVDLEGGTVDRLRDVIAHSPAAADVYATGDRKLWRRHGRVIGDAVRAVGFNTDFAPVFDLAFAPARPVLTTRAVSDDPKDTIAYAREFLRGLHDVGVLGCGKHFPGLGEASLDTHKELPSIRKDFDALWQQDLMPYRALRREVPFVMVAHANYPDVTRDRLPASLSEKWMRGILRNKIGYKNLVITDDLEMGGVLAAADMGDAAVETLRAGADMYLVCHNEEHVWTAHDAVMRAAGRDRKFARIVAERARRVRGLKRKERALRREVSVPKEATVRQLRTQILELRAAVEKAAAERL